MLADLKPWGNYTAPEMYEAGGMAVVGKRLLEAGLLHASEKTVTGRTIGEEVRAAREPAGQQVIRSLAQALKPEGGLAILRGNLAPGGCVIKVSGQKKDSHRGPARVFEREEDAFKAVKKGRIKPNDVIVIRYEGPKGGPGMREMLHVTGALQGAGLGETRGPHDRRPLLGRHPRLHDRPHRARGRRPRAHRRDQERRHHQHRREEAPARSRGVRPPR